MHDVVKNLTPPNMFNLFISSNILHKHDTRFSSKDNYFIKFFRLEKQNNSFSRVGGKIWSSIPTDLRRLPKNNFKKHLHQKLLHLLSKEDDYIDQKDIIKKIGKCLEERI